MAIIKIGDSSAEQTSRRSAVMRATTQDQTGRGRIRAMKTSDGKHRQMPLEDPLADQDSAAVPFVPAFDLLEYGANKALPSNSEIAAIASAVFYSRRLQRKLQTSGHRNWGLIALKEGLR